MIWETNTDAPFSTKTSSKVKGAVVTSSQGFRTPPASQISKFLRLNSLKQELSAPMHNPDHYISDWTEDQP